MMTRCVHSGSSDCGKWSRCEYPECVIRTPWLPRTATNAGEVDTVHQQDIRWRRGR